jgi:dTDP-glucose pyrophosphorylase
MSTRPFLLFLGDIFYVPKGLETMLSSFEREGVSAVLAVKREEDPTSIHKNFSVAVDGSMRVSKVVEKPRYLDQQLEGLRDVPVRPRDLRRHPPDAAHGRCATSTS